MSEPIKSPQNSNNELFAPQAQPPQPNTSWPKNTVRNFVYVISLMGLVALLFWLVIPTNPPASIAQVTPVATATAGGWEVPITSTVVPTQTPEITPTRTPAVIGVVATIYPTPTQAPPPTATPTFERVPANPDGSVTVGGYTFSQPQKVNLSVDLNHSLDIIGWLPDNPDEIVANNEGRAVGINVYSGQVRYFSPPSAKDIYFLNVKLLKGNRIFFQAGYDIWLSQADDQQATQPILTNSKYDPILLVDRQSVLLYNQLTLDTQLINPLGQIEQPSQTYDQLLAPVKLSSETDRHYNSVTSSDGTWVAFNNYEQLILINLATGENKKIPLGVDHAIRVNWSPDGQKLALLVTEGESMYPYIKLFVFEPETENLTEIKTKFRYITNTTWDPNSQQILFSANIGTALNSQGFTYDTSELFLVDIISKKFHFVPIFPTGSFVNEGWNLAWSPDGQKIAISAGIPSNLSLLHRIDVSKQ